MAERHRIVVVEDEQIVAADLKQTLEDLSFEVVGVADSAETAVALVNATDPDLILMDIYLEGSVNGVVVAQQITAQRHIPVVFLTANTDEEMLVNALGAGPYGYLVKPFRANELNATILVALEQHRLVYRLFSRHQWLQTMIESLSDGVIATDSKARVQYLNAVAQRLTGWSAEDAVGKDIREVFDIEDLAGEPVELCQLKKALSVRRPVGRERFFLRTKGGGGLPIEDSASPIVEDGVTIGAVAVFVDITERLRREHDADQLKDRLEEQVQSTTMALGQTRAELQKLSAHLMTAQEEERRWLARELHDDFGQRTAIVEMETTRALELVSEEHAELRKSLAMIRGQIAAISDGLRTVAHRLHPSILADLGLVSALRALVEDIRENGGEASARLPEACPELGLEPATALYRIAQEALRNAAKHAPGAPVRVTLEASPQTVQLTVEDAGPGFDLRDSRVTGGLGLVSMQERARSAGGMLFLSTRPGDGTTLTVRVPVIS